MMREDTFQKRRAELSAAKQALLEKRLQRSFTPATQALPMAVAAPSSSGTTPLSFRQHRLWFLQQMQPQSAVYNEPIAVHLHGPLHLPALAQVATALSLRHAVLRTTFPLQDGQVVQLVHPPEPQQSSLPLLDLSVLPASERQAALHRHIQTEVQRPFDLTQDYPWRTLLLRLAPEEHVCLTIMHHIVTDAWSMEVFVREVGLLYAAFCAGQPSPLPPLPVQYAQYAQWQRQQVDEAFLTSHLAYWKRHLAGPLPRLNLPTDHARPPEQRYEGRRLPLGISAQTTQALHALSRQQGVTLFMTLLAALQLVLARLSQQQDVLIGSPIAGRTRPELEGLLGCFVNTLVLRTDLSGQPSVQELLQRVRAVTLGAYEHQDVPFEKLVEELQPERSLSHAPFFQVMFTLQNVPLASRELAGLTISAAPLEHTTAKFDLSLTLQELPEWLEGFLEYNTALFEEATIGRVAAYLQRVLQAMVADPTQGIEEIPLLSLEEERLLLLNASPMVEETSEALEEPYMRLFAQQVQRTPEAVAVLFQDRHLTYRQLHQRVCELAGQLRRLDAGPEQLVAVLAERGPDLLVALLALLQVGAAYLPLDPHAPPARLRQVLERSGSPLVLTTTSLIPLGQQVVQALSPQRQPTFYNLQDVPSTNTLLDDQPFASQPGQLAYVIYTSGSTGVPKGAMVEQQGMLNHLFAKIDALHLSAEDVVAQTASQCFDISVWQFLAVLLVGGSVHILPDAIAHDPGALLHTLAQQPLSVLETVPSLLRFLLDVAEAAGAQPPPLPHLRWLIPTGEALPPELCRRWLQVYPQVPLLNAYGPTECSDDVTHAPIVEPPPASVTSMSIGQALPNLRLYVLDRHLRPTPLGVSGEIYVGGIGVGRGYLGEPERTAQSFLPDPFSGRAGARLYKTGDRARYLPDGSLEFQGRLDQQVKLRGYRIELGEIEAVLHGHAEVREAVVLLREDELGNQQLVAYVVGRAAPSLGSEQLRLYLKERLPEYMVPSVIVLLEALPIGPTGKLDRHALPPPERGYLAVNGYVAPRTSLEEVLVGIWQQLLGVARIGIHDDFFEAGGHSLLVTQVIARVREIFQVDLPMQVLFKSPTIAELAEAVEQVLARSEELRKPAIQPISREAYRTRLSSLVSSTGTGFPHMETEG